MNTQILNETPTPIPQPPSPSNWANWSHLSLEAKFNLKQNAFSKAKGKNAQDNRDAQDNRMQLLQQNFTKLDLTDSDCSG
jgi:hypothetical protein